jgi:serine protease Do
MSHDLVQSSGDHRLRRSALALSLALVVLLLAPNRGYAKELASAGSSPAQPAAVTAPAQQADGDYVPITDKSGVLSVEVPASWDDIEETEWALDDEPVGTKLTAAPDLEDFANDWGVPGLVLSYSESLPAEMTVEELLDMIDYSDVCEEGEREELPDGELIGMYQIWGNCDDTDTVAAVAALTPADSPDYYVLMEIYAVTDEDLDAMEHIIDTLLVGGAQSDEPAANTTTDSPLLDSIDTSDLTYSYVELRDPAIVAVVPAEYEEVKAAVWEGSDGDPLGYTLTAAPNIQDFNDTWTTPGMIVSSAIDLQEQLDPDEVLKNDSLVENCTYDDRYTDEREVDGVTYLVDYDWYDKCDDTESAYVVGLAQTDPADIAIFFDFLIADAADEEALDVFLQTFSVDRELAASSPSDTRANDEPLADEPQGPALMDVTDATGTISLRVPETWSDTRSEDWDLGDGPIGVSLYVAPDVDEFNESWEAPGMFVAVSEEIAGDFTPVEVLDVLDFADECTYDDRYDYESDNLEGVYDVWADCGEVEGATFVVLAAKPVGEESPLLLLQVAMPTEEDTAVFGEIINTVAVAGAVASVEATQQEELLDEPLAVVEVDSLNIRSGPGTNYNRVGVASQGDALIVNGQIDSCDWLQITTVDGIEGWASGKEQYVTLDTRCTDIPEAERPAPPPASASSGSEETGARSGQESSQGSAASGSASQGCYLFQNQLGAELTITFTRTDTGRGATFKVAGGGEVEKCFDPGRYTYTMDAPPPWNSINGELTVQAGDAFLFPIAGE